MCCWGRLPVRRLRPPESSRMKTFSFYWHPELEAAVKEACAKLEQPYEMSLTSKGEIAAVVRAVNQGIDSHLEACYIKKRGDSYEPGERSHFATSGIEGFCKAGDKLTMHTLECRISPESLPVLIRRLMEDYVEIADEGGMGLASGILETLDIEVI